MSNIILRQSQPMPRETHRDKLTRRARRGQIQDLISEARNEVLAFKKQNATFQTDQYAQQLVDHLQQVQAESAQLYAQRIYCYIRNNQGTFCYRFRNTLAELIIKRFRTCQVLLQSLSCLIEKCQQIEVLQEVYSRDFVEALFQDNWNEQKNTTNNISAIVSLIHTLMKHYERFCQFQVLNGVQAQIQSLGFLHTTYIKFMAFAASKNFNLASKICIQYYLGLANTSFGSDQGLFFDVCLVLTHYFSCRPLPKAFLSWLKTSLNSQLSADSVQVLLQFTLSSLKSAAISQGQVDDLRQACFDEICNIAKTRFIDCQVLGLKIIEQFLKRTNSNLCCSLVDKNDLLTFVATLLAKDQTALDSLVVLAYILKSNARYEQQGRLIQLNAMLESLCGSRNVRVAEISYLILLNFELS